MKFTRSTNGSYVCDHADYSAIIAPELGSMSLPTGKVRKGKGWQVIVFNNGGVAHTRHVSTLIEGKSAATAFIHKAVYSN